MIMTKTIPEEIYEQVKAAQAILILQPDNPDGDSIGTALALEEIFGDMGKRALLYSYREPDTYLRLLEGWDRISQKLPKEFDLTVVVDTASPSLLSATLDHHSKDLITRPMIVIDHHASRSEMGFKTIDLIKPDAAATAEMVYFLAEALKWPINPRAATKLASALLSDSLNLTIPTVTVETVLALAGMVRHGANLSELHRAKREASALSPELLKVKGELLANVEYAADGKLALCSISPEIMDKHKAEHDPSDLVIWEMQWTKGVDVAAVLRHYGTKIKVSMRAKRPIANLIAEKFEGGGHPGAAAFRAEGTDMAAAKTALIKAFVEVDLATK